MSVAVISTGYGKQKATILITGSGANTVQVTDLRANTLDVITGATISRIWWATANTTAGISVARGANVLLTLTGTGEFNLEGTVIAKDNAANLVITTPDAVSAFYMEVHKMYATPPAMP